MSKRPYYKGICIRSIKELRWVINRNRSKGRKGVLNGIDTRELEYYLFVKGWSINELAKKLGISRTPIYKYMLWLKGMKKEAGSRSNHLPMKNVKTGMLYENAVYTVLKRKIREHGLHNFVKVEHIGKETIGSDVDVIAVYNGVKIGEHKEGKGRLIEIECKNYGQYPHKISGNVSKRFRSKESIKALFGTYLNLITEKERRRLESKGVELYSVGEQVTVHNLSKCMRRLNVLLEDVVRKMKEKFGLQGFNYEVHEDEGYLMQTVLMCTCLDVYLIYEWLFANTDLCKVVDTIVDVLYR